MTIPADNTLALNPPRRPTEADFGGTEQEDDALFTPDPRTMPTAGGYKLLIRMLAAAWRMSGLAHLPITYSGGSPVKGTPQAGDPAITSSTFTVARTAATPAGALDITWPADTFPAATRSPQAEIDDPAHGSWLFPTCEPITNGVRVKTKNSAGTLADVGFTLIVH